MRQRLRGPSWPDFVREAGHPIALASPENVCGVPCGGYFLREVAHPDGVLHQKPSAGGPSAGILYTKIGSQKVLLELAPVWSGAEQSRALPCAVHAYVCCLKKYALYYFVPNELPTKGYPENNAKCNRKCLINEKTRPRFAWANPVLLLAFSCPSHQLYGDLLVAKFTSLG